MVRQAAPYLIGVLVCLAPALAAPADVALVEALAPGYRPATSRVMARHVPVPTRRALDLAAYEGNNLLVAPAGEPAAQAIETVALPGVLGAVTADLEATPLTAAERALPLAMEPLLAYLAEWDYDLSDPVLLAAARLEAETWGGEPRATPLQRAAVGWLHERDGGTDLWVRIDFDPAARFTTPPNDADGDGRRELYAHLDAALAPKLVARIRDDYSVRPLSDDETDKWASELVAHWYPRYNTYLEPNGPWPGDDVEAAVLEELDGERFIAPSVVIRGKPGERLLYNVFIIGDQPQATARPGWRFVADEVSANVARWRQELAHYGGGSWTAWAARGEPWRQAVRRQLGERPEELQGVPGRDGWLFFRGSLNYALAGDLRDQADGRDPFPAIVDFQQQLAAKGIDLLLVILPAKPEIHPEQIADWPADAGPIVQPHTRKLLLELADAGVEAVDLLPALLTAKGEGDDALYLPLDTHWSPRAGEVAAAAIAERVKQYPWYTAGTVDYTTREVAFNRQGDIVPMLAPAEKVGLRPMRLTARQVIGPDGAPYADDPNSPIVVLGDSFCGIYHHEDCEHAGLTAHLARELGQPVDLVMAHGSGPRIRGLLARRGAAAINAKKLVIWTVVARDLYGYWAPWDVIRMP